ncbi:glycosyltransferase family 2 protein [Streptomyces sp. M-16]|uniref:glycosyltransferase family 2 protein n=1 Tax=Streptomyces sp. M-16 TaxID=3233040 RepID=UPI003F967962
MTAWVRRIGQAEAGRERASAPADAAATLGAAVRSVLTQTHPDLELLATDDQSSDGSTDLLREFAEQDERVLPESAPEQGGAGRARNRAIQRARGDYIAFLDSDDMWLPEKTEKQLAFAARATAPFDVHLVLQDGRRLRRREHRLGPERAGGPCAGARGLPGGAGPRPHRCAHCHVRPQCPGNEADAQYNWALYREHEHLSVPRATRALAGAVWQSLRNSRI